MTLKLGIKGFSDIENINIAKKSDDVLLKVYTSIFEKINNSTPNLKIGYLGVLDVRITNMTVKSPKYTLKNLQVNFAKN